MSKSKVKPMLIVFSGCKGAVHKKIERKRVACVCPAIVDAWKLHYDNASNYTVFPIMNYLTMHRVPTLSQSPYSPDIAELAFPLPIFKRIMKGRRHGLVKAIQEIVTR